LPQLSFRGADPSDTDYESLAREMIGIARRTLNSALENLQAVSSAEVPSGSLRLQSLGSQVVLKTEHRTYTGLALLKELANYTENSSNNYFDASQIRNHLGGLSERAPVLQRLKEFHRLGLLACYAQSSDPDWVLSTLGKRILSDFNRSENPKETRQYELIRELIHFPEEYPTTPLLNIPKGHPLRTTPSPLPGLLQETLLRIGSKAYTGFELLQILDQQAHKRNKALPSFYTQDFYSILEAEDNSEIEAISCALLQLAAAGLLDQLNPSDKRWSLSLGGKAVLHNRSRWQADDLNVIGNCIQGPASLQAHAEDLKHKRLEHLERSILALMGRESTGLTGFDLLQQIDRINKQRSSFSRFFMGSIKVQNLSKSIPGAQGEEGLTRLKSQLQALEELDLVLLGEDQYRCMLAQRGERILKAPNPSLGLRLQPTDLDKIIGNTLSLLEEHKKKQQQAVLALIEMASQAIEGLDATNQQAVQQAKVLMEELNTLKPNGEKPTKERVLSQTKFEETLLELDFNAMRSSNADAIASDLLQTLETTCAMYHTWLHRTNLQVRSLYQARLNLEQEQVRQKFKVLQQKFSQTGQEPSVSGKAIDEMAVQLVNLMQGSAFGGRDAEEVVSEFHLEQKANAVMTLQQLTQRLAELRSEVEVVDEDLLDQLASEIRAQPKASEQA